MRVVGALAVAGALSACADRPTHVAVRVTLDGMPVPGLDVIAYPFDPERLLDSLGAAVPEPRPDFSALEREMLASPLPHPRSTTRRRSGGARRATASCRWPTP